VRYLDSSWLVAEYEGGRSIVSLAEQTHVSPDELRKVLTAEGVEIRSDIVARRVRGGVWSGLREKAEAARRQLEEGPKEWPGRPSAQRLALFLEASPGTVLALLDDLDALVMEMPGGSR